MTLFRHPAKLYISELEKAPVPPAHGFWALIREPGGVFTLLSELDLVNSATPKPYTAYQLEGPIPHDAIGILAGLLEVLKQAQVPVFSYSTYKTDWVLVPACREETTESALAEANHLIDTTTLNRHRIRVTRIRRIRSSPAEPGDRSHTPSKHD